MYEFRVYKYLTLQLTFNIYIFRLLTLNPGVLLVTNTKKFSMAMVMKMLIFIFIVVKVK